ncbi:putative photosynthetic complex assembly protein [Loktanella sp. DSM 29012]|uniref:photosynthetic complex assembly protein PuhC n=1 Tax=Loktanella sp. DSM 29012 TaxID=1881056 RepID=UPI0008C47AD3|nr:photosynthetic complex assembly protein PuhC [Loktanella sp. DSM 29012]SEP67598.1 putative photosynthetic complex assembly protein [Loktanella sp. DSM 29012]
MTESTFKAPTDVEMVPRLLVVAMFGLMLITLSIAFFARTTDAPLVGVVPASPIVQSVDVALIGDRNGAYSVIGADGTVLAVSDRDKAGFIGVIGRVVARKRDTTGLPLDAPVQVVRRADGIVAIIDPLTQMDVPLMGYGQDNVAAFARLLD